MTPSYGRVQHLENWLRQTLVTNHRANEGDAVHCSGKTACFSCFKVPRIIKEWNKRFPLRHCVYRREPVVCSDPVNMQSHPPTLPRAYSDPPQLKSRTYVQLFAWFGLVIAVLHLFEGRNLGLLQLILSAIGIYASWEDVTNRKTFVSFYAFGCFVWTVLDTLYLLLLIVACSKRLHQWMVDLLVANTFSNLATALDELFDALAKDAHFFELFSVVTSVLFDAMASFWAWSLYVDVIEALATSDMHIPLIRPTAPPDRPGIAGFGSLSRPQSGRASPRSLNPFTGRGFRLGDGDT